jgi:lipopolysaccharide transport system permease protein
VQLRAVLLWGGPIDWIAWSLSLFIGAVVFYLGFAWFQKTRKGFADVL